MDLNKVQKYLLSLNPFWVSCFHLVLVYLIYQLLLLGSFITSIDVYHFKQWDAYWYAGIAKDGYQFSETQPSNTAFFPMFPYLWKALWKISNAGVGQICLFNALAFLAGMLVLKKAFQFSWAYFLLFVSVPSNMFIYVPYSEAIFFFFSAITLAGFKTDSKVMIMGGLFLASLARPSAAFFIPAILSMEVLNYKDFKTFLKNTASYLTPPLLAILLVFVIQYQATGVWFAFFKDGWRRVAQLPELPLTTWDGLKTLWLDGIAFFFGLLATVVLLILLYRKLKGFHSPEYGKAEVFSTTYVMMALFTILIFGGRDKDGGTSLLSLNRFLMATPYFTIMLYMLSFQVKLNLKTYILYAVVALISLSLLNLNGTGYNEYTLNDKFFYALIMLVHIFLYSTISLRYNGKFIALVYIVNVGIQVIILQQFAHGKWIG